MDELDADLFGKASKNPPLSSSKPGTPNKGVSFKSNPPAKDFDLDDPLAGILSDEESTSVKRKAPVADEKKKPTTDIVFDDDDDGPLGSMLIDDDSNTKISHLELDKKISKKQNLFDDDDDDSNGAGKDEPETKFDKEDTEFVSPLDKFFAKSSTETSQKPSATTRKFRFDKDGNLITEKSASPAGKPPPSPATAKTPAEKEDLSFGSYLPSTAVSRPSRSRPTSSSKPESDFLSFLNEGASKTPAKKASGTIDTSKQTPPRTPTRRPANILNLDDEVDLDAEDKRRSSISSGAKPEDDFLSFLTRDTPVKKPAPVVAASKLVPPRSTGLRSNNADFLELGDEIDIDSSDDDTEKPPTSASTPKSDPLAKPDISAPKIPTSNKPETRPTTQFQASSYLPPQIQPLTKVIPPSNESFGDISATSVIPSISMPIRSPPKHFESNVPDKTILGVGHTPHNQDVMREVKRHFDQDLLLTKQAYEERVQALHTEVAEIRIRSEREVDAIKESYNKRMEIIRKQMKDQLEDVYDKDSSDQSEIKKLRSLHLKALEDTRLDYESRIKIMKDSHSKDIDAIKSSTEYVRNLEGMMKKVDDSSEKLESLSSKYESVFHNMTQKWNDMSSDNKRFMSGVQTRIDQIHQSNLEMQNNLQIIVSRLEGSMSEMSRAMRESQTQMQLERSRLEALQTSVDNEKKHLLQQVAAERTDVMNAHREAIELRQKYERGNREDSERLKQWQEYLLQSQRILEEARSAEVKQTADREAEWRRIENHLAKERSAVLEKTERLSSLEARLTVQKEEVERREAALDESEKRRLEKEEKLRNREDEIKIGEERASKKLEASMSVLEEAKRVEDEYETRLNEIHNDSNNVAKQRQLLAEERKHLIEDRLTHDTSNILVKSPLGSPRKAFVFPKKNTSSPNNAANASAAFWNFTAQKDRQFLEDEHIFLEALKMSPYKTPDKIFTND